MTDLSGTPIRKHVHLGLEIQLLSSHVSCRPCAILISLTKTAVPYRGDGFIKVSRAGERRRRACSGTKKLLSCFAPIYLLSVSLCEHPLTFLDCFVL